MQKNLYTVLSLPKQKHGQDSPKYPLIYLKFTQLFTRQTDEKFDEGDKNKNEKLLV